MSATATVPDLRALKLVLTAGCNLRCSYCYQSDKKNLRIDWAIVRAALDRLLASPRSDVELLFIGGEPLLEFPTIERAVAYVAEHKRSDMTVRHAIITNGMLLGEREIAFLGSHRFLVQLSFDGLPPAQGLRGEHTFERLDALLDTLRQRYPGVYEHQLRVNITFTPATLLHLPDSVDYFLFDKRLQDLSLTPQMTAAPDWRPERIAELDHVFARLFRSSMRRYRETGEVPLQTFRKTERRRPGRRPAQISMCGVSRGDQLAVDVDGRTHGCLMFVESYQVFPTTFLKSRVEALRLGDIRDAALDDRLRLYPETVRNQEIFHHKELKYSSYGRCGECKYLAECSVCPMSIGRVDGDADPRHVPDFNCAFNLVSLKYRARFPRLKSLDEVFARTSRGGIWDVLAGRRTGRPRKPHRPHARTGGTITEQGA
jgi:uncharacterized protein